MPTRKRALSAANRQVIPDAAQLERVLAQEIVPRMLMAHRSASGDALARLHASRDFRTLTLDVDMTVGLALEASGEAFETQMLSLADAGVPLATLYLELLGPAARRLGELWERDAVTFLDVTMALGRLQRASHRLRAHRPPRAPTPSSGRSMLVTVVPGEQHVFGAMLLGDLFERAGWRVLQEAGAAEGELIEAVRSARLDLVAISASTQASVERLPALIVALRAASERGRLVVMVGGKPFCEAPDLALQVGADGTATDAVSAVRTAENLLDLALRMD